MLGGAVVVVRMAPPRVTAFDDFKSDAQARSSPSVGRKPKVLLHSLGCLDGMGGLSGAGWINAKQWTYLVAWVLTRYGRCFVLTYNVLLNNLNTFFKAIFRQIVVLTDILKPAKRAENTRTFC